jgi:hypothetical protein
MGFLNGKKVIKTEGFQPLDLNEGNVQAIFNRCLANEEEKRVFDKRVKLQILKPQLTNRESEEIILSTEKTKKNRKNIKFLFGQLKNIHLGDEATSVIGLKEGFIKYGDTVWTREYDMLFKLYAMAQLSGCLFDFSSFKKAPNLIAATKSVTLVPTLSPKDPNFPAWWEEHKSEWED